MQTNFSSPEGARAIEGRAADRTAGQSAAYIFGRYFWLTLLLFILMVICVGPFWNTAVDDDWAYELTVKHLLDTGHYQLHEWAAANMPFQVYWGALFAKVAGLCHASLRISTLVLWLVGLIAFYCLGLEQGFAPEEAGLLMLTLFSSPMLVRMSFSFMTDVPYLSCFIITLFLWTRALRTRHLGLMFLGSMAAAAAILTRQFGAVLIGGVVLLWLAGRERARNAALFGIGLLLPLVALGWQFRQMSTTPSWAMKGNFLGQADYFLDPGALLKGFLWRPVIALEYLAFFTPPLVLLLLAGLVDRRRRAAGHDLPRSGVSRMLLLVAVWVIGVLVVSSPWRLGPLLMPYLPYRFQVLERAPVLVRALITGLTTMGAILLGWSFGKRYLPPSKWNGLPGYARLLDLTTLCVLGEVLVFWSLMDDYLMPLLPYCVLVVGHQWRSALDRVRRPLVICCVAVLACSIMFARSYLAWREAFWKGAEALRMTGVESCEISGGFEWLGYHCFRAFLAEHGNERSDWETYFNWLAAQRARGKYEYLLTTKPTSADLRDYEPFRQITYTPLPYWHRKLYVLRRIDHQLPHPGTAKIPPVGISTRLSGVNPLRKPMLSRFTFSGSPPWRMETSPWTLLKRWNANCGPSGRQSKLFTKKPSAARLRPRALFS